MASPHNFAAAAALSGLSPRTRRKMMGLRISAAMLAATGCLSVLLVSWLEAPDVADLYALPILAYACWLYGGLGLFYLLAPDAQEGLSMLRLRGVHFEPLWLKSWNIFRHLALGIAAAGLPGVVLAAILGTHYVSVWSKLGFILAATLYTLLLSGVLATVGGISGRISNSGARFIGTLLLIVPFLASFYEDNLPNIIGLFIQGFGLLTGSGETV
jgi:hypothetical protein